MKCYNLLGLEYEPDFVDLMLSEKSEPEIKRLFLLGMQKDLELKLEELLKFKGRPRGRPKSILSIDEHRGRFILKLKAIFPYERRSIKEWITFAREIEKNIEPGYKMCGEVLNHTDRPLFLSAPASDSRLESSVCAGLKKLETWRLQKLKS